MIKLRSILNDIIYFLFTFSVVLVFVLLQIFPWNWLQNSVNLWAKALGVVAKIVAGIDVRIIGLENIPKDGRVLIAAKHQSAWDTSFFQILFPRSVYVMKKELLSIPLWGWVARKVGSIAVDREGGASALKSMLHTTSKRLDEGRTVIIFPEGTRTLPGKSIDLHPGVAAIYKNCKVPVVPVALNSGLLWGRTTFGQKYPGTITVEFLPVIEPGLDRKAFMAELKTAIDTNTDKLEQEAIAQYPLVKNRMVD